MNVLVSNSSEKPSFGHTTKSPNDWGELASLFNTRKAFMNEINEFISEAKDLLEAGQKEELMDLLTKFLKNH